MRTISTVNFFDIYMRWFLVTHKKQCVSQDSVIEQLLAQNYFGNTGMDYAVALGVFFGVIVATWIFKKYLLHLFKRAAQRTETELDDQIIEILNQIPKPFYLIFALYVSTRTLAMPVWLSRVFYYLFIAVAVYYVVKLAQLFVDLAVKNISKARGEDNEQSMLILIGRIVKGMLWGVALLVILANFGIEITPLIAGMGIGGLAIAFAFQNILEDLFSSFSIYFDKPFEVGDFIIVGSDMGIVKYIGLKTTRLTTLQGQELIISNRELTSTRINNYKRMEKRRIVFSIGVEYATPLDKLKFINELVADVFESIEIVDLDRSHFKEFGDSSLDYEIVYYINSNDYVDYMNAQQEINFGILERFREHEIGVAFPTRTLHLINEDTK